MQEKEERKSLKLKIFLLLVKTRIELGIFTGLSLLRIFTKHNFTSDQRAHYKLTTFSI